MDSSSINNKKTIEQIIKTTAETKGTRKTGEMGKDDFLNLMVTQLKYQDPLNPTDDKEFIGQMAQFSSLEQMQNMSASLSSAKAFNLIGKYINASFKDEKTFETKNVEGEVTSVKISSGKTFAIVRGEEVPIDNITDVQNVETAKAKTSNLSAHTGLIGFNVNGAVTNPETNDTVNITGRVMELVKGEDDDFAVVDGVNINVMSIVGAEELKTQEEKQGYLNDKIGKTAQFKIFDPSTFKSVEIKGNLASFEFVGSKLKAVLNDLSVPIDSISKIAIE